MPFNTTPDIDFSAIGLITDVPPHSLPPGALSDCLNIRPKDASVQGVLAFKSAGIGLFGDHYSLPDNSCYLISDGSLVLNEENVTPEDEASCTALGDATTHEWVPNKAVAALVAATSALGLVTTEVEDGYQSIADSITEARETVSVAEQAIIDKNILLLASERQLSLDEWSLGTLNSYYYDRWQDAITKNDAAIEAESLLTTTFN